MQLCTIRKCVDGDAPPEPLLSLPLCVLPDSHADIHHGHTGAAANHISIVFVTWKRKPPHLGQKSQ